MGFQGISPSVGVTLDTYQNSNPDNDPFYDHIAIQLNGIINHSSPSTLTPLTPISATNNNVEDCLDHNIRIVWNAISKNMTVFFDGQQRVTTTYDFVNNVFGGNNLVYWGFTGATGGLNNLQKFCTSLTPSFYFPATQNRCVNEPITFLDSTISFTGLQKRYWNFGDGSPIDSVNINPVHTYTAPGIYNVTLKVIGLDGCEAVFPQLVYVGGKPIAGFTYTASCVLNNVQFTDTSRVPLGTINNWYWSLDNAGFTSTSQNPSTIYTTPGTKNIKFVVKTLEGCVSDTLFVPIEVNERAVVDFSFTDSVCFGTATSFTDLSTVGGSTGGVNYWQWTYSDSSFPATIQNPTHVFSTPGNHTVTLISSGSGSNNCAGSSITKTIFVTDKPIAALKKFVACERQSIQLQDSSYTPDGTAIGSCWWDLGNGQFSNQCNPRVTYTGAGPITIKHVVFNARGCKSDTLTITIDVEDKPSVKFGLVHLFVTTAVYGLLIVQQL
jgi:PKD repeat protein